MRSIILPLLAMLAVLMAQSCTPKPAQDPSPLQNSAFAEMLENYNEGRLKLFPMDATQEGDARYNDVFQIEISQPYRKELAAFYQSYLEQLTKYDPATLLPEEQMSWEILKWECDIRLQALNFDTHLLPVTQFRSPTLTFGQWGAGASAQPFKTSEDYENWLSRLENYTAWADTAMANMRQGMEVGIVLPKTLIQKIIPQMEAFGKGPVDDHILFTPVKKLPKEMAEKDRIRIENAYRTLIANKIIPLQQKLATFFKEEYLPAGRETSGISDLAWGREFYDHQIKVYTTTEMTADEIFNLGEKEVQRLESEMEQIKDQVGFGGSLKEFFVDLREKPELMPFTEPQQVIDNFNTIHERMKPNLENLFDLVPKTAFEVRRTESFREKSGSAEYNPGSKDGSRPGVFYVPIPEVEKYNMLSDEDLFLHEAIPGHHYQISLQQENENLPNFRRSLWYSSYGEGWALYSESLGEELGLYEDPYQYFGMLSAEMHRAIRLVVDVGLHVKGWTREEAIAYSLEHEAESEAAITAEIERYMSWPGQALSYKIGQLKIRELRGRAETSFGDKFNIKEFHRICLESGCVPLKVLEDKVNRWIEKGTQAPE